MKQGNYIFTSESVSKGHPDKVSDQISDALVDAGLKNGDETTRVAVETLVTTNHVTVAGEVKNFNVSNDEVKQIIRDKVKEIGYEQDGFHWDNLNIYNEIHSQSGDIGLGTDNFGAGDQGIMFGYACTDNDAMLPAPIHYSHEILKRLDAMRAEGYEFLLPDAKSQVSVQYEGGKVKRIDQVVISHQHKEGFVHSVRAPAKDAAEEVLGDLIDKDTVWHINPTGNFCIGGPDGDAGLTGRKIIVDTYGGAAPHGGGAFSGKDPTKVDRSAAYASRYLAKNVVAAGLAERCTIQLSYAIGVSQPLSIYVDMHGTGSVEAAALQNALGAVMDLSPRGIREHLGLNKPIYARTAAYGHFGRAPEADGGFSWERTDLADAIKAAL